MTKEQLVAEVQRLERRIADLEARLGEAESGGRPAGAPSRPPRKDFDADVEFVGDFDVMQARGVNISEEGICFEVAEDLPFEMRFEVGGEEQVRRAHCVWVKRLPQGGYHFGLRFVPPKAFPEF